MEHTAPLESPVDPVVVRPAKDLDRPARDWLQHLFGRPLRDDENVTMVLSAPHPAPSAADRQAAFQKMEQVLDRAAENMRNVPDEEFEQAADEASQEPGKAQHLIPSYCEYINKYVLQAAKRGKSEVPGEHHFVALYLVPRLSRFPFLGVPHYVNPDGMKAIAGDVIYFSYAPEKNVCYIPTHRLKIEVKLENPIDRSIQLTRTQYYHWIRQERTPEEQGKLVLGEHPDKPEQPDLFVGISQHGIVLLPWAEFRAVFIKVVYPTCLPEIPKIKGRPSNTGSFPMKRFEEWAKETSSRFHFLYTKKLEDWPRLESLFLDSLTNQCRELTKDSPIVPLEHRVDV